MNGFSKRLHGLADLLLQAQCPLCQRATADVFCRDCQRQIERCQFAKAAWVQRQLPVFAWGCYSGALRRTIAAFKYENKPHLARPLAHWLARTWLSVVDQRATPFTVVPIPMHASKRQQRGFNQADLLAEHFCEQTRLPLQVNGLARSRDTTAQFALSADDRTQNLADAFSLGSAFRKRHPTGTVLLLDDIYTTGATAHSAAQTLRRHGIRVYGMVVLARAEMERGKE